MALVLAAALAVAGCGSGDTEPPPGAQPQGQEGDVDGPLEPVMVADLGDTATGLAAHPTEPLLLAARRSGGIYPIRLVSADGYVVPELGADPVLDLSGTVTTEGERGLLDLTFAPDGAHLFVSYTDPDGAVTVARYPFDGETGAVDASDPLLLAGVEHPYAGHNGGDLEWLDDDTLLWALGDMDLTTTSPPAAQDPTDPLGAIVRLDVADPSPRPATGDELTGPALAVVGLRNPWRIHVDQGAGVLYIGDVGDNRVEEIDRIPVEDLGGPGGPAPPNLGWPYYEGSERTEHPFDGGDTFVEPVYERPHADDVCAVVAGVAVPDEVDRERSGQLLLGDNCSGDVLALDDQGTAAVVAEIDDGVVAFAEGADDDVYALGIQGGIWRLDPAGWSVAPPELPTLDDPPEDTGNQGDDESLPLDQHQSVCDVRAAFAVLDGVPGADPQDYERLALEASTRFTEAVDGLPDRIDPTPFRTIFRQVVAVGRATGWDTGSPEFRALFDAIVDAEAPFQAFPDANAVLVDLGADC